jgi:peptidoglycan/xylan/chitin deacetylase (PgdA/CDA1 family)
MDAGSQHRRLARPLLIGAVLVALTVPGHAAQAAPAGSPRPSQSEVLAADPATVTPPAQTFAAQAPGCPDARYGVQSTAPGAGKTVALTFDDGPGRSTAEILRVLSSKRVAATFFNVGINENANPAMVRATRDQGFLLANHTWSHPDMTTLGSAQQAAEMDNATNQQASIVGARPCFFRPPYGAYNATTLSLADARNMAVFNWSVDTRDWEARGSSDPYWVNRIISLAQAGGSQTHPVVLFHNSPTGNPATVAALPTIIDFYRDRGYTFVDLAGRVKADPALRDISPVAVAAARTDVGTTLAFVRGTDGALYVTTGTSTGFGAYRKIPAGTRSGPAAVSWDGRRVDLFVVGTDRALWHTSTVVDSQGRPTTFARWDSLGGALTTAPAVASHAAGRLLVSARGTDGALWSRTWNGTRWSSWSSLAGRAISAPAVDVVEAGTYRALVVGSDGAVWQKRLSATGSALTGWSSTGVRSGFAPAASATAGWSRAIRAVATSRGDGVRQVWGNGSVHDIGGVVTSAVALAEAGATTTWTFARGSDNALWANRATAAGGSSWQRIGGALG